MIVFKNKADSEINRRFYNLIKDGYSWLIKNISIRWWVVLVVIGLVGGFKIINKKNIPARINLKVDLVKQTLITGYYRLTTKPKESLILDIGFKEIKKIQAKRTGAINQGVLFSSSADLVSADIRYQDEVIPVKVRLKGDWLDHLLTSKWSLRVETDQDTPFKGMRRFSLQVPEARNFINEWLFLKTIKEEGLISLNYDFLKVSINGESQGIYALEEHISKEVIERNERREGPVLKFNADRFWNSVSQFGGKSRFSARESLVDDYYFKSAVEGFGEAQLKKDPVLAQQLQLAVNKLQGYREGWLSPSQVFDYESWSSYLVLADLFGADHGFFWENYRFYYNPVTGLFEPIPFDNEPGKMIEYLAVHEPESEPLTRLFNNQEFIKEYVKKLKIYSDQKYIATKISEASEEIDYYTRLLRQDYPDFNFDPMSFYENADFMRQSVLVDQGLRVSVTDGVEQTNSLQMENLLQLPVEVLAVTDDQGNNLLNQTQVLNGTQEYQLPEIIKIRLNQSILTDDQSLGQLLVSFRLLGLTEESEVRTASVQLSRLTSLSYFQGYSPKEIGFIKYDYQTGSYIIPQGSFSLNKLVVIPAGSQLYVSGGAKINIKPGGGIVSYSPVYFDGNELNPIVIDGNNGQGQGLLVIKAKDKSVVNQTKFIGLKPIETNNHLTLGAVNFYESNVEINGAEFISNLSEDQLNIIRSEFLVKNSSFVKAMSDGVDFDFSQGQIIDSRFVEMANDGVDFSGSKAEIKGLLVDGAGDKGISVGERSQVLVNKALIKNAKLGVASKDLSEVTLGNEISFENLEVGLAVYQKKPEYGPAIINQDLISALKVKTDFMIEKGSVLQQLLKTVKGTEKNLGEKFQ